MFFLLYGVGCPGIHARAASIGGPHTTGPASTPAASCRLRFSPLGRLRRPFGVRCCKSSRFFACSCCGGSFREAHRGRRVSPRWRGFASAVSPPGRLRPPASGFPLGPCPSPSRLGRLFSRAAGRDFAGPSFFLRTQKQGFKN